MTKRLFFGLCALYLNLHDVIAVETTSPLRFAIVGLSHDHANGFIPRVRDRSDVQLVGIVEAKPELVTRYARRFNLPQDFFYPSLDALLARTNIQAIAVFTSTFEHKAVVQLAASHSIHVMMEKPLAVNMDHARAIADASKKNRIKVVVNYETTWYTGNQAAYNLVHEKEGIGDLRKIVVHDGHRGPREIGCSEDFLAWLTDPVLNGGGALTDFDCYGADLTTWLMDEQRPIAVTAVTQQIKPDVYPKVDDEATIILTYPKAQAILQASWNWPFDRKDIEIYGRTGQIIVPKPDILLMRKPNSSEVESQAPALKGPHADPLSYLAAVVHGEIEPSGLSSLSVNMIVTEILDAARESARTGRQVVLPR